MARRTWLIGSLVAVHACGGGAASPVQPVTSYAGVIHEIARVDEPILDLDVASAPGGALRAGVLDRRGARLWERAAGAADWRDVGSYPGATALALADGGAGFVAALVDGEGIKVVDAQGVAHALSAPIDPGLALVELHVLGGPVGGIVALAEAHRVGRSPLVHVMHYPLAGRQSRGVPLFTAGVSLLSFDAAAHQSALDVCSTRDRAVIAIGSTRIIESDGRIASVPVLNGLTFDVTAQTWRPLLPASFQYPPAILEETVGFTPGSLVVSCRGSAPRLMVRPGRAWMIALAPDGEPTSPVRVLDYGAGYGLLQGAMAGCGNRLIWIDNRLERGVDGFPLNPARGGLWSDDYPGWGITTVFTASYDELGAEKAIPLRLSSPLGRQVAIAARPDDGACLVIWAGRRTVDKAGPPPGEGHTALFVTRLDLTLGTKTP